LFLFLPPTHELCHFFISLQPTNSASLPLGLVVHTLDEGGGVIQGDPCNTKKAKKINKE
jgi:hypothetical protein